MDIHCPPTAYGAKWVQEGLYEGFPDPGTVDEYIVEWHEPAGHRFHDPDHGNFTLHEVRWDPQWDDLPHRSFFRLDAEGVVSIHTVDSLEAKRLQEGFLNFTGALTGADETMLDAWAEEFVASPTQLHPITYTDGSGEKRQAVLMEYMLRVQAPYHFEDHYDSMLEEATLSMRPDPWAGMEVRLGEWRFAFPAPFSVAAHISDSHELRVDARDHVTFDWPNPPMGTSWGELHDAIYATHAALGLAEPVGVEDMEVQEVFC